MSWECPTDKLRPGEIINNMGFCIYDISDRKLYERAIFHFSHFLKYFHFDIRFQEKIYINQSILLTFFYCILDSSHFKFYQLLELIYYSYSDINLKCSPPFLPLCLNGEYAKGTIVSFCCGELYEEDVNYKYRNNKTFVQWH